MAIRIESAERSLTRLHGVTELPATGNSIYLSDVLVAGHLFYEDGRQAAASVGSSNLFITQKHKLQFLQHVLSTVPRRLYFVRRTKRID